MSCLLLKKVLNLFIALLLSSFGNIEKLEKVNDDEIYKINEAIGRIKHSIKNLNGKIKTKLNIKHKLDLPLNKKLSLNDRE